LLSKAIDLAELQVKLLQDAAHVSNKAVPIYPYIVYARWYHKELSLLHSTEELSPEVEQKFADFISSGQATRA
jgi:hypothetical protein